MNARSMSQFRVNEKLPVDQLQPFLHARESEPVSVDRLFRVKSRASILHGQLYASGAAQQRDLEVSGSAMLKRILQGFPQDAE